MGTQMDSTDPVLCFFCCRELGRCPSAGSTSTGNNGNNSNMCSLNALSKYFRISTTRTPVSPPLGSGPTPRIGLDGGLEVELCGRCAPLRNTLSELLHLKEVVEMKLKYWLEDLQGVMWRADRANQELIESGKKIESKTEQQLHSLRRAFRESCSQKIVNCFRTVPQVRVRIGRPPKSGSAILQTSTNFGTQPTLISSLTTEDQFNQEGRSFNNSLETGASLGTIAPPLEISTTDTEIVPDPEWSPPSSPSAVCPDDDFVSDMEPFSIKKKSDEGSKPETQVATKTKRKVKSRGFTSKKAKLSPPPSSNSNSDHKAPPRKNPNVKPEIGTKNKAKSEVTISKKAKRPLPSPSDLRCPTCERQFRSLKILAEHREMVHEKVRTTCDKCGKSFSPTYFYQHQRLSCTAIPSETRTKLRFETRKSYLCHMCDKSFSARSCLFTHIQNKHSEIEHKCPRCNRKFSYADSLKKHLLLKTCQEKKPEMEHVCDICSKGFPTGKKLDYHKYRNHRFHFECETCGKSWGRKDLWKEHMAKHHGHPVEDSDTEESRKKEEKKKKLNLKRKDRFECSEEGADASFRTGGS